MICQICGKYFSQKIVINGVKHHLTSKRKYCVDCVPLGKAHHSKLYDFTADDLQKILDTSNTYIEVLTKCGLTSNSNNYNTLNRLIKKYDLNLDSINANRQKVQATKYTRYTKESFTQAIIAGNISDGSSKLLKKIVKFGIKPYVCECCGLSSWNNKPISLELHHEDGNRRNNKLSNLKILCPNCHSQTDNFRSKNKTNIGS